MPIIVLDGPDAVGKTTLAKAFEKRYRNVKYIHLEYRWSNKMFHYHTAAFKRALKWSRQGFIVIIDRWWMSESCYAKAYRGGSAWPMHGRFLTRLGLTHSVVYVMCLPDMFTLDVFDKMKRERNEQYDDIKKVCDLYSQLYFGDQSHTETGDYIDQVIKLGGYMRASYVMPYSIQNWGSPALMNCFVDLVLQRSEEMRQDQFDAVMTSDNFLGHRKFANYLLVGEQVNPKFRDVKWPFFEYGNSSLFLTSTLHDLWVKEDSLAFTNIRDANGNVDTEFIRLCSEDKIIIALGSEAKNIMKRRGFTCDYHIKHPSWYKRFNSSEFKEDLEDIIC
tara:strand:+ start:745 stop:1743 length:999 start_codon:yes stop_codon:yes gene_type:complete